MSVIANKSDIAMNIGLAMGLILAAASLTLLTHLISDSLWSVVTGQSLPAGSALPTAPLPRDLLQDPSLPQAATVLRGREGPDQEMAPTF